MPRMESNVDANVRSRTQRHFRRAAGNRWGCGFVTENNPAWSGSTRPKPAATKNIEVYNAYLQGHFYFQRRNLEDYRKAVGQYDEATGLDPQYALAYAERSEAWT